MPLYDAVKLWRAERRKRQAAETSGFIALSVAAALLAGCCGLFSPVEHYCVALVAVTLALIAVPRLAGGYKMQTPLLIAALAVAWFYFEIGDDFFTLIPLSSVLKYWLFGLAALGAAGVWFVFTAGLNPKSANAGTQAESASYSAGIALALLWVLAAHYIPRHF